MGAAIWPWALVTGASDGIGEAFARRLATADIDLGLLVAAAGFGTSGPLLEAGLADEAEMVDLNCRAVMAQAWHFGQRFARRRRGGIVFMSSLLAFQGTPRAAH